MLDPFPLNHNGPPAYDSADDLPPGIPRMHYFKCDIEALWGVLVEMPLELGGFYMRTLLAMYKNMEGLPADDNVARMRLGGMDIRTYRRMKAALLGRPKCLIEKPSGRISNERFEEEVTAYVTEFKNRQKAAFEREEKRKAVPSKPVTSGELRPDFQPKLNGSRTKVGEVSRELPANQSAEVSEKINQINGHATTILPEPSQSGGTAVDPHARVLELELEKKRREESQQQVRDSDSATRDVAATAPPNWRELEKRLEEAAGAALASKASYPGLMNLSDPISWISAGADLELDVIPAVAFVSAKTLASRNFRPIKSWAYFRNAVADFKGNRERGLPTPVPVGQEDPTAPNTESKADRLRREAKERMAARANGASL
jgi:uncharacterized protein YdaU (DUF1376 family)